MNGWRRLDLHDRMGIMKSVSRVLGPVASTAVLVALMAIPSFAGTAMTLDADAQASLTPTIALQSLKSGNERFVRGESLDRILLQQVEQTAAGQYPLGVVLGCIDSRVPPEYVFDQGIGDIFATRIAGNFVNTDILGSMEFATAVAKSKVLVVLGHTSCGAVKGACDRVELGNLTSMLQNLMPAVDSVDGYEGERNSKSPEFVQAVAEANVHQTVRKLLQDSPVMNDLVNEGSLIVVGAMHDVLTGQVSWFDPADSIP
jgi:carbonic anhydrase